MGVRCPICGAENPEGKMFCGDCGTGLPQPPPPPPAQPTQPTYAQPTPSWIRSNWKGLVAVVVVLVVVLAVVGAYTQPWSKVKVIVSFESWHGTVINVYIDGKSNVSIDLEHGTTTVGVWSVYAGSHNVSIDNASWNTLWNGYVYYREYEPPDGKMDFVYAFSVGPLSTRNVHIDLPSPF